MIQHDRSDAVIGEGILVVTFAAVDLGATSGRVSIGRADAGGLLADEVWRFGNRPITLDGRLHWNTPALLADTLDGLGHAVAAAGDDAIAGIGVDAWGVDFSLIRPGHEDSPLVPHYRSAASKAVERFHERLSRAQAYAATGIQPDAINTVYRLPGDSIAVDARLLFIPDLWVRALSGDIGTEASIASTSGLLDARDDRWSDVVIAAAGVSHDLLPKVHGAGAAAGALLSPVRSMIGAAYDIPVFRVAEHDTASAVAAIPATGPDFAFISCGTWSLVGMQVIDPVLTQEALAAGFTNERGAYASFLLMRNLPGLTLLDRCVSAWGGSAITDRLAEALLQASDAPATAHLVDVLDDRFVRASDLPHAIAEYCAATGQGAPSSRAEIIRCVIDSLALAHRRAVLAAERLSGRDAPVVHLVGGGARNALLCQATADACERPVHAGPSEASTLGNIAVQAISTGVFSGIEEARAAVRGSNPMSTHQPDRHTARLWRDADRRMDDISARAKGT